MSPYYKSLKQKEVVLKLSKKLIIKVGTEPQFFQQENLHILFPEHIQKIETLDEKVRKEVIRQNPQTFAEKYLKDSLPSGSWKGHKCFIIGGGPSLKGFNFLQLLGEKVIAVNKAFVNAPFAEIQFSIDRQFQDWLTNLEKGGPTMKRAWEIWPEFQGHKVWLKVPGEIYQGNIEFVSSAGPEGISESLEEGIFDGSNSGYAAINLAIALGANPIYLLGFDMKHDGGQSHYHEGYPKPQSEFQLSLFVKKFNKLAKEVEKKEIKIINLNPNSALKCFDFGTMENALIPILPLMREYPYIITSFYTPEYVNEISTLIQSVRKYNLPYDFQLIKALPLEGAQQNKNWSKNAYYKAEFLKEMLEKYPNKDIIWIDADAIICQNPVLFNKMPDCDIAIHFRDNVELLSGTIYLRNNEATKKLINLWIEENQKSKNFLEQKNLETAIIKTQKEIKVFNLPATYCQIFDTMGQAGEPVVKQMQASRKWRRNEKRTKKITVVMPTYNQGKFIQESIDSVLNQTFKNFELIIVDDGSTDNTKEILDQQIDPRIKIIHKDNGGTGSALNLGFENSIGEYETWLASDNKYYPNALQEMHDILETKKNIDFVYCNCEIGIMDHTGLSEIYKKNYNEEISMEWDAYRFYEHHNIGVVWLWKKELRLISGTYFIKEPCEDYDMTIRMIEADGQFYYHPIVLGWHRRHDGNLTKNLINSGQYIQNLVKRMVRRRDNKQKTELIFTDIYRDNKWHGKESKSGEGSSLDSTKKIREELPKLFKKYNIRTIIDAACGDWNWMKVAIKKIEFDRYMGFDIVKDIIIKNTNTYANDKITFRNMNLINQNLSEKADVIFCRDMLNHLSDFDIIEVLKNFIMSGSEYVLMTNFTKNRKNRDIITGAWRTVNYQKPPFLFPSPIETINEGCNATDITGTYEDKELALWKLDDISEIIFKKAATPKHKQLVVDIAIEDAMRLLKQTPEPIDQPNLEKWCLEKIPKKIFFYWGAEILPFLHYLTVKSFIKFNPDWQVVFYRPKELSLEKPWSGWEHKYKLNCPDYMDELLELPLELRYFDARCLGLSNKYPEIIKSDFLRWYLLGTEGGVWADMDIIFTSPMNNLRFNYEKNKEIDTVVAICEDFLPEFMFHTIGFMMSSGNNSYYNYICEKSKKINTTFIDYEMIGNQLLNVEFPNIKKIQSKFPALKIENLPFDTLYMYYPLKRVPELFNDYGRERRTKNSIGVHWYAGHFCVEKFVNNITSLNYNDYINTPIGRLIQEVIE